MELPYHQMVGRPAHLQQMFNILTESLPETITVDGEKCYLKTHFKRWITFELIITDPKLEDNLKLAAILPLCFKKLPSNIDVAVKACMKFYRGNISQKNKEEKGSFKPAYSFLYDAELIFAAFMSQYGVDLTAADMHWYTFMALFKGLGTDNKFSEVMNLRSINLAEINDLKLKKKYQELKRFWALPDIRSDKEKNNEIIQAVEELL